MALEEFSWPSTVSGTVDRHNYSLLLLDNFLLHSTSVLSKPAILLSAILGH